MKGIGLIPRNRLRHIPEHLRVYQELCFFFHDECTRALIEYETARAHIETIKFRTSTEAEKFNVLVKNTDVVGALRELGYRDASKRVVLNTIRMAMISDCLHHVYEALRCFEKRKFIVGFNLLRKPLTENLLYISWMYGREDEFYCQFTEGGPKALTMKELGEKRKTIYADAIANLDQDYMFDPETLVNTINNKRNDSGYQSLFQHAVHLVTTWNPQMQTEAENFNFIFKNPSDDDVYDFLYESLPMILLFMSHVIVGVFDRMEIMDETSRHLFELRTVLAYHLVAGSDKPLALSAFEEMLAVWPKCFMCSREGKVTVYNALGMLLKSEFRCTYCGALSPYLLFSYPECQE